MKYKSFNFCVFFIILALVWPETFPELTASCRDRVLFVCMCVCVSVCVWLKQTDPLQGGLEECGGWSLHQHTVYGGTRTLWPQCELSGGLQRPLQRPEVSIHAHDKQCTALQSYREKTVTWASTHFTNHPVILRAFLPFILINKFMYSSFSMFSTE